jgi:hypothetical protein
MPGSAFPRFFFLTIVVVQNVSLGMTDRGTGRKVGWIVKWYGKYRRKVSWIMKRCGNYGRKVSWIVKTFGKYRRKLWNDMENMEEK